MRLVQLRAAVRLAAVFAVGLSACRSASFAQLSSPEGGPGAASGDGAAAEGPPPRAVFPELSFNYGEVQQGEEVVHAFKVRNTGEGVLRLKSRGS